MSGELKIRSAIAGALTGAVNGLLGGGGGSALVPLLTRFCHLSQREAFATSVAVVLPLCLLSAAVYLLRGGLDWAGAVPYLIGGAIGGFAGGRWFKGVNMLWLKRGFGLLLLYGGVRCFL